MSSAATPSSTPLRCPGAGITPVALVLALAGCAGSRLERTEAAGDETRRAPAPAAIPSTPPAAAPSAPVEAADLLAAELATVGWDSLSSGPVVLLRTLESGKLLPIWIGPAEARAIDLALHGVETPRPMTHDLMAALLAAMGGTLEEIQIVDLREGTYFALLKVRVRGEGDPRWIDSRPSDGLALALRTGAGIRLAKKLLDDQPPVEFLAPESPEQIVRALGLTIVAATPERRAELGLPAGRAGVLVLRASGEAERAGLRRGDLLTSAAGRPLAEPVDFLGAIAALAPGGILPLTVWRDGAELEIELSLDAAPAEPDDSIVA